MCGPVDPATLRRVACHGDVRIPQKTVIPVATAPFRRISFQFFVALAQQKECVVITAQPHVEAMLFDPAGSAATRRSLSSEAPADLKYRNVVGAPVPGMSQFESGGNGRATATDDSDFYGLSSPQLPLSHFVGAAGCTPSVIRILQYRCYMFLQPL
jgi:hypothetical protein